MVFDYIEGEGVGGDVYIFVGDVGFAITGEVAEEVRRLVEVGDGVGLFAHEVVEAVGAVGVDEAIADPLARTHGFVDVGHDFEGGFDAIFVNLSGREGGEVVFPGEAQDVEGFIAGKGDEFTGFGPVDLEGIRYGDWRDGNG